MKMRYAILLAGVVGFGLGAAAIQGLRAQAAPPAFYIAANNVTDLNGYLSDFTAKSTPYVNSSGGRVLSQGGKVASLAGVAPNLRVFIAQFDSMDKLLAWYQSPQAAEYAKIALKYATVQNFAVEALPQ